jgi:hypothetical protein
MTPLTLIRTAIAGCFAALALGPALGEAQAQTAAPATATAEQNDRYRQALYLRETGKPYAAIDSLEALLAASPTLNRARLELAVAYYRTLAFDQARAEVQAVLDDPSTPEAVRLSALSFLKQLEAEQASLFGQPHRLDKTLSVGLIYDDNVTAGPNIALLPNGLLLDPGSLREDDWGAQAQAGLTHTWTRQSPVRVGESGAARFSWVSQLGLYHRDYQRLDDYDLTVLTASTGPALLMQGGHRANLNIQADHLRLGNETLAHFSTLAPSVTFRLAQGELTLDGQLSYRDYKRVVDTGRSGPYRSLSVSYGHLLSGGRLAVQGGVGVFEERADASWLANDGAEGFAGLRLRAWDGGDLFARASLRHSRYEGRVPTFDQKRHEIERRLEIGASHLFASGALEDWQLNWTATYIDNAANVDLYDYHRTLTSLTLSRGF